MPTDFRQLYAKKQYWTKKLKELCPEIDNQSGIYILHRRDENDSLIHAYIGLAVNLLDRLCSHLMNYSQHIDISLKKRGLYNNSNPYGWNATVRHFPKEQLNDKERQYIKEAQERGWELYNITGGGQDKGKVDIADRKPPKGYQDGIAQGKKQTQREIAKLFEKNLTFSINGEPNKNKQKAYDKFKSFIEPPKE